MATCANPGCDQPGTNKCSACKTTPYCGPICQTADWIHHKEECPGHLRKVGMANLQKALVFHRERRNYLQILHHAELAATKLKQLKDRPVELIDEALALKHDALFFTGQYREALECAKEWYCLWPAKHTHPPAIRASFALILDCINNKEFFDATLYARTLWETITLSQDSHIPEHMLQPFTARGARLLARALWHLAASGDMPPEEKHETGKEAIMLARRALEINTQLHGVENDEEVADGMDLLASVLGYFNDIEDDEIIRLGEQAISIFARVQGIMSFNVAMCESNLGKSYNRRANRAIDAHDLDQSVANLELALPRYREAARIYRAINHMDKADEAARSAASIEEWLRQRQVAAKEQQQEEEE